MPDIRINLSFPNHRKTKKLVALGGEGMIRHLLKLWCYAAEHKQNGTLSNMEDLDISLAADYIGTDFVKKVIDAGFIDDVFPRKLHDWKHHQRWIIHAPKRQAQARKAAAKRWERKDKKQCPQHAGSNAVSNAGSNADSEMSNAPSPSPIPSPNPKHSSLPSEKKKAPPFSNQENTADVVRQGLSNALEADNDQIRRHLIGESEKSEDVRRKIAESRASVKPPKLTPLQQSFEDWRSTDTIWLEQLRMSEALSSQIKSIDNAYSLTEFIKSYLNDLSHDVYNRPDKFNNVPDERRWRNLLKGYIRTGIKDGKIGDYGMKGKMSAVDESKMENEKRRR